MRQLSVFIEKNGKQLHVGQIYGNDHDDACFSYVPDYLEMDDPVPISIGLPLSKAPFSPQQTRNFFEGLLPEGFSRKAVAQWIKTDEHDYLTILKHLGQECLGAIAINYDPDYQNSGYQRLSKEQVRELAREGVTSSVKLLMETHLSLTGATGKAGLYLDEKNGEFYLPYGQCASTHIVKQSHVRLRQIVLNEQLCLLTAKHIGIEVPESSVIRLGSMKDEDILFATKRYDRKVVGSATGMPIVRRLHQEDFAQAMGISSEKKYEHENKGYLSGMFRLIRENASDPIADQIRLWDRIVFDYLIGNTDGHLKNYSILYDENLGGKRLAPAYDIICTGIYGNMKEMSLFIGDDLILEKINRESFLKAAESANLGRKAAMQRFDYLAAQFEEALSCAVREMESVGFEDAGEIGQKILECGGYCRIL